MCLLTIAEFSVLVGAIEEVVEDSTPLLEVGASWLDARLFIKVELRLDEKFTDYWN